MLVGADGLVALGATGTTTIGLMLLDGLTTLAGAPCSCDDTVLYRSFCFPVFTEDEMVSEIQTLKNSNPSANNIKLILCILPYQIN